jgi:hypothetical protein
MAEVVNVSSDRHYSQNVHYLSLFSILYNKSITLQQIDNAMNSFLIYCDLIQLWWQLQDKVDAPPPPFPISTGNLEPDRS